MSGGPRLRVLMIEDDLEASDLLVELLSPDFEVRQAADGILGLEIFTREGADVVITDESLPRLRGTEVARAIKRLSPDTRVILVSGFIRPPGSEICDAVMTKPVNLNELVRLIGSPSQTGSEPALAW